MIGSGNALVSHQHQLIQSKPPGPFLYGLHKEGHGQHVLFVVLLRLQLAVFLLQVRFPRRKGLGSRRGSALLRLPKRNDLADIVTGNHNA